MAFPIPPYTDGQLHTEGTTNYVYNATVKAWNKVVAGGGTPTGSLTGTLSVTGGGDFTAARTLSLVNDAAAPGANMLYGTSSTGVKGWRSAPKEFTSFYGVWDSTQSVPAYSGVSATIPHFFAVAPGYTVIGTGINVLSNDFMTGCRLQLLAGRSYIINASITPADPAAYANRYIITNGANGAALMSAPFASRCTWIVSVGASNVSINIAYYSGATAITDHTGSLAVYSVD